MKKYFATIVLCFFSVFIHADYVIIDDIVYWLNLEYLTASVENFQTSTSIVTIPPYVYYRGDKYKVTYLSYESFSTSAYNAYKASSMFFGEGIITDGITEMAMAQEKSELPFRYDYEDVRAGIIQLNLPSTLESISYDAFKGMKRLKTLIIPASLESLGDDNHDDALLTYAPRMESIVVYGAPTFYRDKKNIELQSVNEEGFPIYKEELGKKIGIQKCPNLKSFQVPAFDDIWAKYQAKLKIFEAYNKELADVSNAIRKKYLQMSTIGTPVIVNSALQDESMLNTAYQQAKDYLIYQTVVAGADDMLRTLKIKYETALRSNPFYDGSHLTINHHYPTKCESTSESYVQMTVRGAIRDLDRQYQQKMNGGMEANMKANKPLEYLKVYCSLHPEKGIIRDSIDREYRCLDVYRRAQITIDIFDGKKAPESCREQIWRSEGKRLYPSYEDYNAHYNDAQTHSIFMNEIHVRENAQYNYDEFVSYVVANAKKIRVQNMKTKPNEQSVAVVQYFNKLSTYTSIASVHDYYYDLSINFLFSMIPSLQKEYAKKGRYFPSKKDFFEAYSYSSDSYNSIIKENKKKSKK